MHEIRVGTPIPRKYLGESNNDKSIYDWIAFVLDTIMAVDGGIVSFSILIICVLALVSGAFFILLKIVLFLILM